MPQHWLNNFSEPLTAALPANEMTILPLPQATLNKLVALLPEKDDWILLTLSSADGSGPSEIVRYQPSGTTFLPLRRSWEGTDAQDWPAGTLCSCNATAEALTNFETSRDLVQEFSGSELNITGAENLRSTWGWFPSAAGELSLRVNGYGYREGESPLSRQLIELWPEGSGPLVLHLPDMGDAYFDIPAGTTGTNVDGSYTLTIPESPTGCYIIEIVQHGAMIVRIQNYAGLTTF